jgi:hypothetical protein
MIFFLDLMKVSYFLCLFSPFLLSFFDADQRGLEVEPDGEVDPALEW